MKRPPTSRSVPAPSSSIPPGEIRRLLDAGRGREAIEPCKALIKQEPSGGHEPLLVEAYVLRAGELESKGMVKEALILLENADRLTAFPGLAERRLDLLWRLHRFEAAAVLHFSLESTPGRESSGANPTFPERLAPRLLTGEVPPKVIPPNSPWIGWLATARQALSAFDQGDETRLAESLKGISLRSPFKPLRWLLPALNEAGRDPARARQRVEGIGPDSPWSPWARLVEAATLDVPELARRLSELPPREAGMTLRLRGEDPGPSQRLREILALPLPRRVQVLLKEKMDPSWPEALLRRALLGWMVESPSPGCFHAYEQRFGPLDPLERLRLAALAAERSHLEHLPDHWRPVLAWLEKAPPTPEGDLALALIHRRVGDFYFETRRDHPDGAYHLRQSLNCDPKDRDGWLRLLEWLKDQNMDREYRQRLELALRHFPQDAALLGAATREAFEGEAFAKAAKRAQQWLEADPLHPAPRAMLVRSNAAQARKQIRSGRNDLAERSLQEAERFARPDGEEAGVVGINRAFLLWHQDRVEEGESLLREVVRTLGGDGAAHLQVQVEALLLGGEVGLKRWAAQISSPTPQGLPPRDDLLRRMAVIEAYLTQPKVDWKGLLLGMQPLLFEGAKLNFSADELRRIGRILDHLERYELLERYAARGEKLHPGEPIFKAWKTIARCGGDSFRLSQAAAKRLEAVHDQARQAGDHEARARIDQFMRENDLSDGDYEEAIVHELKEISGQKDSPAHRRLERAMDELPPLPKAEERRLVDTIAQGVREIRRDVPGLNDREAIKNEIKRLFREEAGFPDFMLNSQLFEGVLEKGLDRAGIARRPAAGTSSPSADVSTAPKGGNPPPPPPPRPAGPKPPTDPRQLIFDFGEES
ncbi:MAG: hypothetical protein HQL51_11265 [Magnetococcales bacterium]|nr:hypothetical protein [Magnetococcales bacterium]